MIKTAAGTAPHNRASGGIAATLLRFIHVADQAVQERFATCTAPVISESIAA
jgi:hypothetical protein